MGKDGKSSAVVAALLVRPLHIMQAILMCLTEEVDCDFCHSSCPFFKAATSFSLVTGPSFSDAYTSKSDHQHSYRGCACVPKAKEN